MPKPSPASYWRPIADCGTWKCVPPDCRMRSRRSRTGPDDECDVEHVAAPAVARVSDRYEIRVCSDDPEPDRLRLVTGDARRDVHVPECCAGGNDRSAG